MKSSKKLFAILTLVAFMMTLVPMAAFGAANKISTTFAVSPTSVKADDAALTTLTIDFGATPYVTGDGILYVWAERNGQIVNEEAINSATVVATGTSTGAWVNRSSSIIQYTPAAGDSITKLQIKLNSAFAGSVTLKAGIAAVVAPAGIPSVGEMTSNGKFVNSATVSFTAGTLSKTNTAASFPAAGTTTYVVGASAKTVTITVKDTNGYVMKDVAIKVSADRSEDTVSADEKTDSAGKADINFKSTKQGTSNVTVYANGSEMGSFDVVVSGATSDKVEYVSDGDGIIATTNAMNIIFKLLDKNGNPADIVSKLPATNVTGAGAVKIKIDGPAGSAMDEAIYYPNIAEQTSVAGEERFTDATTGVHAYYETANGKLHIGKDNTGVGQWNVADEGTYKVTVSIAGEDISASTTFEVKDQGTITGATLSYNQKALKWGAITDAPTLKYVDAAGVKLAAAATAFNFAVNDPRLATVNNTNVPAGSQGKVTAKTPINDLTGKLIVTATDATKKVYATAEIAIVGEPASLAYTAPKGTVGASATVNLQLKDINGAAAAYGDVATPTMSLVVVEKPEGAIVTTSKGTDWDKALERTGAPYFTVRSDKAGTVKVNVVVSDGTNYTSVIVPVEFGTVTPAIGAKSVTLFLGAKAFMQDGVAKMTDVAPFIKDSRTFVEVRSLATAFGAEVAWDATTQTVTLTRSDMTVTIVIGGAVTKTVGGVASAVASDAPAFITAEGRTVLPFRAVGEAFGATVSYDAATQSVSFTQ